MSALPNGWIEAPLMGTVLLHDGRRIPLNQEQRQKKQGPYPYYGANGLVDHIDEYIFEGEHALLAEDGGYFDQPERGVAYGVTGRFWVNNHAHILEPLGGINVSFLVRWLNAVNWLPFVSGTTRLKLTQSGMQRVIVPLPPLAEQRRIVAKLDELDASSKRARADLDRIPALVARAKQALLEKAFRGELTSDWRVSARKPASEEEAESYAEDRRKAAWRVWVSEQKSKRSYKQPQAIDWKPDFRLPEGWHWLSVDQLCAATQYGSSAKTDDDASGVPVLRMGNIQDGRLDFSNLKFLPRKHSEFPELLLQDGDLLFNRTNSSELVGKTAVFEERAEDCSFASYLIRLRVAAYQPKLLSAYINSSIGRRWIKSVVTQQVGQANVNGTKLGGLAVPFMPEDEQLEILRRIESAFAKIDRIAADAASASKLLNRLDQALLSKAFRGELVPQDPNDEPAEKLLERIESARAGAPKQKRTRKTKETP